MIKSRPCRVLVVDDSALYRKIIRASLEGIPGVEIVGAAYDGMDAIAQCKQINPDMMTLDVTMPRMDGLETLQEIRKFNPTVGIIMVSSLTSQGAQITTRALTLGAFDFVLKPSGSSMEENVRQLRSDLEERINAFLPTVRQRMSTNVDSRGTGNNTVNRSSMLLPSSSLVRSSSPAANVDSKNPSNSPAGSKPSLPGSVPGGADALLPRGAQPIERSEQESGSVSGVQSFRPPMNFKCECVAIGISTGGPQALGKVIPQISPSIPVPIFIVQHMPPLFTKSLADCLSATSKLKVHEATHGQQVLPGEVYIAPGGKHMRVNKTLIKATIELTDDPPVQSCRPSVDYLFDSLNNSYGGKTLAIIMTGMGGDGVDGCRKIHKSGGRIVAQEASTCTVYGMPRQVVENNLAHDIVQLDAIANLINRITSKAVLV